MASVHFSLNKEPHWKYCHYIGLPHWQSLLGGGGGLKGLEQPTFFQVLLAGKFLLLLIFARATPRAFSKARSWGSCNCCWGHQNLLIPLPGDTWTCVCPGILSVAWVELYKWESLQTKGQCWDGCGLSRPWLGHITRVVWGEVSINHCSQLASTTTMEFCSWISRRA